MFSHLSCINFTLQCSVSLHSSKICFTSSFSKHNGHLPLSAFLLTPFSCHIPAISHVIPLLSFLEQHSMYNFLPQENFNFLYRVIFYISTQLKYFWIIYYSLLLFIYLLRLSYVSFNEYILLPSLITPPFSSLMFHVPKFFCFKLCLSPVFLSTDRHSQKHISASRYNHNWILLPCYAVCLYTIRVT
jgi:hypothetical protein